MFYQFVFPDDILRITRLVLTTEPSRPPCSRVHMLLNFIQSLSDCLFYSSHSALFSVLLLSLSIKEYHRVSETAFFVFVCFQQPTIHMSWQLKHKTSTAIWVDLQFLCKCNWRHTVIARNCSKRLCFFTARGVFSYYKNSTCHAFVQYSCFYAVKIENKTEGCHLQ